MNRVPKSATNHPFCCDKCPGSFTRKEHLLRHYRTHENIKPYECSVCPQTFGRKDLRDRHERNLHQTIRPPVLRKQSELPSPPIRPGGSSPFPFRSSSLTPEMQSMYLEYFFNCFASSMPVIHRPTFRPEKREPGLVRCMMSIGGYYSTDGHALKLSQAMFQEECNQVRQYFTTSRTDDPGLLDYVTEVLLLASFASSHLEDFHVDDTRDLLLEALTQARKLGLGKSLVTRASRAPESLHQRWLEWVRYESFKRLGILYFITDALCTCLHNRSPRMFILELKQNMPVDELIWNARTAEQWQTICVAVSANTEGPIIEATSILLKSFCVPENMNELGSILLSVCLLKNILELSSAMVLYNTKGASNKTSPNRCGFGTQFSAEIAGREAQLRYAMNVLLETTRNQRLKLSMPTTMWDITSTIQQFGYLRLYLPSAMASHGIVAHGWASAMQETVYAIVTENMGNINYRPTTLLLNWFVELILSQTHLQYQDAAQQGNAMYVATESSIGCTTLIQVMFDIWRVFRFTIIHREQLCFSPELAGARQDFLAEIRELVDFVGGISDRATMVREDELSRALAQVCINMYRATRMSTLKVASECFQLLTKLLHEQMNNAIITGPERPTGAWAMLSRSI